MKFGNAHGTSRPEVGSAKCIDVYAATGVPPFSLIFGTSEQKMMTPTMFLGPKQNFYSLTVCNLDQY